MRAFRANNGSQVIRLAVKCACFEAQSFALRMRVSGRRWSAAETKGLALCTAQWRRDEASARRKDVNLFAYKSDAVTDRNALSKQGLEERSSGVTKAALSRLKVSELRSLLNGMGLDSAGLKAELVQKVWENKDILLNQIEAEVHAPAPVADDASSPSSAGSDKVVGRGKESDPVTKDDNPTGMELVFLGTSSGAPTTHRNVSSVALRLHTRIWLFDCGEATQSQILRTKLRQGRIEKIFITHLHGDHIFGLPGMLCTISNARHGGGDEELDIAKEPVKIYGPPGIQDFVLTALRVSQTKLIMPIEIHEYSMTSPAPAVDAERRVAVGKNGKIRLGKVYPDKGHPGLARAANGRISWQGDDPPTWKLVDSEQDMSVTAGALRHRVACFGYVIQENDQPGRLDPDACKALGLPPGPLYKQLKNGIPVKTPEGDLIHPEQVVGAARPGRKVVVLGDTCDSRAIAPIARDADVLVHECTFSDEMKEKALIAGHSTASMAGEFARRIRVDQLILTHFSARYKIRKDGGPRQKMREEEDDDLHAIPLLIRQARRAFHGGNVVAAHDFFHWKIPRKEANTLEIRRDPKEDVA